MPTVGPRSSPTVLGWVCGTEERAGRPSMTRRRVVVDDGGTGLARALMALTVDDGAAERLAPTGDEATDQLAELELSLMPSEGDPGSVEVADRDRDGEPRTVSLDRHLVPHHLLGRLTHERLDRLAGAPTLHGGAVVDDRGRGVVLIGTSGAGKSTLVAHLVHRGLALVNDEQFTLHPGRDVVGGFTRPISVKPGGSAHLPAGVLTAHEGPFGVLVTAADLGGRHELVAAPTLVVVPERDDRHEAPSWSPLTPAELVEACCANNLDLVDKPVEALSAYAWLATRTAGVRLRYRDAVQASELVVGLLEDVAPVPAEWRVEVGDLAGLSPNVVTTVVGDEAVLYHRGSRSVVRLNAAGAEVWAGLPERPEAPAGRELLDALAAHGFLR